MKRNEIYGSNFVEIFDESFLLFSYWVLFGPHFGPPSGPPRRNKTAGQNDIPSSI